MRTEQLIKAISADAATRLAPVWQALALGLAVGAAVAAILFAIKLGPRLDIAAVALDPRFLFKFVVTLLLAASALVLALRLVRPGAEIDAAALYLIAAPLLLGIGVLIELMLVPAPLWSARAVGTNSLYCLTYVPLLSAPLLVATLIAMRRGAPSRPALAGAAAGLLASGLAAALYAAHCTDDSPLFVAVWYTIAVVGVTAIGSLLGKFALRW